MKSTGIVRKIDELGRLVIPVEYRRVNGWEEGDFIEMFVSNNGDLMLRKYSPLDSGSFDRLISDVKRIQEQEKGNLESEHLTQVLLHLEAIRAVRP